MQLKKGDEKIKKTVALAAFAAVAAASTLSFAGGPARTGVNGSLHDMNLYNAPGNAHGGLQDQYNRVCVFCHTPHNATVDDGGMNPLPLWGNDITTKSQDPYQWATPANADALGTPADQLIGPSRLCMTCHDGTLALDAHTSNGTLNNGNFKLTGSRAIGSDDSLLIKTHPIGFDYVVAKTKRNNQTTTVGGVTSTYAIQEIVDEGEGFATKITASPTQGTYNSVERKGTRSIASVLYSGPNGGKIMTCATCHEVHNKENVTQDVAIKGATPNYFLYAKESESLICLSCHVK